MKFKKLLTGLFLTTLTAVAFTGCGQNDSGQTEATNIETEVPESESVTQSESDSSQEEAAAAQPAEIEFWHAMSGQQETTLASLTDQFNNENEYGIKVTLVNQGGYNDLNTKLTANAVADTLPDMAQAYNNWLTPYLDKVIHLDDFVANNFDNYDDIIEGYRDETSQFGFISGVPFNKSTYVYFYNKTLFDDLGLTPPKTWEDLATIGEKFKREKNMVSLGYDDLAGMLEADLNQNSVEYISKEGALFNSEGGLETIQFILDLYGNGYARLAGEDGYFSGPLSNQIIAAYVGSSTGVSYIDTSSGWELGVAPLPGNKVNAANQAGTNLVMFSTDENKQNAAWEYMKFLTSTDATLQWAMETGYLPIRTSAYESETYQSFMKTDATSTAAYSQSEYFFSTPTFDGSYDVMSTVNSKMEEFILNGTEAETALEELVDAINAQVQ